MKLTKFILAAAAVLALGLSANAQEAVKAQSNLASHFKVYGFIRTYAAFDTRESLAGTEDFFYYLPKDVNIKDGEDLNASPSLRFAALTSRLGLDVSGYEVAGWKVGAKIEGDFYAGLSGSTGTAQFRLRQAFMTMNKNAVAIKIGQAWHPMAADMPDVLSLNTGAPFGPFSRTPLAAVDVKVGDYITLSGDIIWQMQYCSNGPEGTSANYIKYGCTPEVYLGVSGAVGPFLGRLGVDVLSIKPRKNNGTVKVSDRITTVSPFLYAQYKQGMFAAKLKTIYAQAGEHFNLNGGYGISSINSDGSYGYTPTRNWSSWLSLSYGKKLQGVLFAGYVRNFGTAKPLAGTADTAVLYFSKNSYSNMNRMWRATPTILYNLGKLTFGLEWEITGVQYGETKNALGFSLLNTETGLYDQGLHWVTNHRLQLMAKFSF